MKRTKQTTNLILAGLLLTAPVMAEDDDKKKPQAPGKGITIKRAAQGTYLGVAMDVIPPIAREQLNLPVGVGVAIAHVAKDSPAAKAGLKVNDVVTQLDDQLIVNAQQFQTLIRTKKPGDEVNLTYIRKGKEQKVKVKLAKGVMPQVAGKQPPAMRLRDGKWEPIPGGGGGLFFGGPNGELRQFQFPGGLGLMRGFQLNPQNQEQFQKQMEQLQKQLQNLQNMDPDELRDLFQQGGGGVLPFPAPNVKPFEFKFDVKPLPGGGQGNKPGNRPFNFNANINSSVTIADNTGSYTLTVANGKKRFKAKNDEGDEIFDGPVDTEKQRDALDRDLFKKLEQLEGMVKGKGGIRLRQFRFNGREADPNGNFNFRFDFPNRKREPKKEAPKKKRSDA